jgi:MFS family permease
MYDCNNGRLIQIKDIAGSIIVNRNGSISVQQCLGPFPFLKAKGSTIVLVGSAVFYAFFYFSTQPMQNYILTRYVPEHQQGLGYGIDFLLTFGVGSIAAAVCGYIADSFGLESAFYAMGLCIIISSILAWIHVIRAKGQRKNVA